MIKVLVPADGSASSQYGVRQVMSEFFKNRDLDIHLLNVQRPFSRRIGQFCTRQSRADFHREQSEAALAPARQALDGAGIPYTVHTDIGNKVDCIVAAASRLECERIVMGTARQNSLTRWLENSVTTRVIERTTVPVEVIAGSRVSSLRRVGIPAGIGTGAGAMLFWLAAQ